MQNATQDPDLATAIRELAQAISQQSGEASSEVASEPAVATGFDFSMDGLANLAVGAKDKLLDFAPALGAAVATLLIGWIVARFASRVLRKILVKAKVDLTLVNFFCSTAYMILMAFVAISAIGQLGVNTASLVAILGAATFAIGFALQGSLANFASGILMILFRPVRHGDLVEAGGVQGIVDEVGVFATTINTLDNKRAIVANGKIMSENIINYSTNGKLRVDMTFGIGYSDDMDKAITIMRKVLIEDKRVLADPAPTVSVVEHGASSINFVCRPYVKPEHYWDVWFDTHKSVKEEFDNQGISIPFPQRDVHMIHD